MPQPSTSKQGEFEAEMAHAERKRSKREARFAEASQEIDRE